MSILTVTLLLAVCGVAAAQNSCAQQSACMRQEMSSMSRCLAAHRARAGTLQGCARQMKDLEVNEMVLEQDFTRQFATCFSSNAQGCPAVSASTFSQYGGGNEYGGMGEGGDMGGFEMGGDMGGPEEGMGGMNFQMQYETWELPCKAFYEGNCWEAITTECAIEERCEQCVEAKTVGGQRTTFKQAYEAIYTQMDALYTGQCKAELERLDEAEWAKYEAANPSVTGQWGGQRKVRRSHGHVKHSGR